MKIDGSIDCLNQNGTNREQPEIQKRLWYRFRAARSSNGEKARAKRQRERVKDMKLGGRDVRRLPGQFEAEQSGPSGISKPLSTAHHHIKLLQCDGR